MRKLVGKIMAEGCIYPDGNQGEDIELRVYADTEAETGVAMEWEPSETDRKYRQTGFIWTMDIMALQAKAMIEAKGDEARAFLKGAVQGAYGKLMKLNSN